VVRYRRFFDFNEPAALSVSHLDSAQGVYQKLVVRDNRLAAAILLGVTDSGGTLL
jgi:NAD(P)H-nitrite reductase large subunit